MHIQFPSTKIIFKNLSLISYFPLPCFGLQLWLQALGADGSLELKVRVNVIVKDINDNRPTFEKDVYTVTVMEERTQGAINLRRHSFFS